MPVSSPSSTANGKNGNTQKTMQEPRKVIDHFRVHMVANLSQLVHFHIGDSIMLVHASLAQKLAVENNDIVSFLIAPKGHKYCEHGVHLMIFCRNVQLAPIGALAEIPPAKIVNGQEGCN